MVPIEQLCIGDKVRIVDVWPAPHREATSGGMDHWLSKVMTVREVRESCVRMEEDETEFDGAGWFWFPEMLAEVVSATRLQIGDRVAANADMGAVINGDTGTVVDLDNSLIGVCWDRKLRGGHTCSDTCKDGHGWYVPQNILLPEGPEETFEIDAAVFDSMFP